MIFVTYIQLRQPHLNRFTLVYHFEKAVFIESNSITTVPFAVEYRTGSFLVDGYCTMPIIDTYSASKEK